MDTCLAHHIPYIAAASIMYINISHSREDKNLGYYWDAACSNIMKLASSSLRNTRIISAGLCWQVHGGKKEKINKYIFFIYYAKMCIAHTYPQQKHGMNWKILENHEIIFFYILNSLLFVEVVLNNDMPWMECLIQSLVIWQHWVYFH